MRNELSNSVHRSRILNVPQGIGRLTCRFSRHFEHVDAQPRSGRDAAFLSSCVEIEGGEE